MMISIIVKNNQFFFIKSNYYTLMNIKNIRKMNAKIKIVKIIFFSY